jgi:hypothetical protein
MVFLLLPLGTFQQSPETLLRVAEGPSFRVEALKSGNTREGHQFFEVVLENITDDCVSGGVSFSSYLPDGTKHYGCDAPGGVGAGEYFTVAPREKVRVQCSRSIVPVDIRLQVTMRLHGVRTYKSPQTSSIVAVADQGVKLVEKGVDYDTYEAWALLEAKRDSRVSYKFRLYDEDGIQVAEHAEDGILAAPAEPEVKRRVKWSTLISRGSKKPVSARTYVFDALDSAEGSEVPPDSKYGRLIQMILGRNYNPPVTNDASGVEYVVVRLRIARDGRIHSLVNGRVAPNSFKRRSANDLIDKVAERAVIASNPLPPFPNGFLVGAQEAVAEIWFRYPK